MVERVFKLSEHKTTVKTEVMAGITTFMTMAYILAVNPKRTRLHRYGYHRGIAGNCPASCLGTLCMAFMANLPFALSAGINECLHGVHRCCRLWLQLAGCAAGRIY